MTRTDRSTTFTRIITGSTNRSSDRSRSQERSKPSTPDLPATSDDTTKMIEEAKKTPGDKPRYAEKEIMPLLYSCFDDRLRGKLPPGHTKPTIVIDAVSRSQVLNYLQLVCFCKLGSDEKCEHVEMLLRAFLLYYSHHANVFPSKQSVLFLQGRLWVYGTATAVNYSIPVT